MQQEDSLKLSAEEVEVLMHLVPEDEDDEELIWTASGSEHGETIRHIMG